MTNEDLQQLKALAMAATPGPWEHDEELTPWRIAGGEVVGGDGTGVSVVFTDYDWHVKVGEEPDTGSAIYESTGEPATIVEGVRNNDAAFMAAANPKAILALIARIESLPAPAVANAAVSELPPLPEPLQIDWPTAHSVALGCGVEDRGIHDRYEAAEYGFEDGVQKAACCVPDVIYDADQILAYGQACIAAAAPNAQLVAALQSALAIINNEADPDEYAAPLAKIRAALSAIKGEKA